MLGAVVTFRELQLDQLPAASRARTVIVYVVRGDRPETVKLVLAVVPSELPFRATS